MEIALAHAVQAVTPQHHEVLFYDVDTELADAVVDYVTAGLSDGELIIVIATAPHLAAIDAALPEARGSYLALDAADTLDLLMVDGSPDAVRFTRVVGGILDAAELDGAPVRVFGEMVALLWQQGNVAGAMALEATWNDLAMYRQFSLLCAYPTTALGSAALCEVNQVCELHSTCPPTEELRGRVLQRHRGRRDHRLEGVRRRARGRLRGARVRPRHVDVVG